MNIKRHFLIMTFISVFVACNKDDPLMKAVENLQINCPFVENKNGDGIISKHE